MYMSVYEVEALGQRPEESFCLVDDATIFQVYCPIPLVVRGLDYESETSSKDLQCFCIFGAVENVVKALFQDGSFHERPRRFFLVTKNDVLQNSARYAEQLRKLLVQFAALV